MYETVSYANAVTATTRSRMTPERQTEVLGAVMELVREVGYERLTFDAVAARARASKATLYRLWQDKPTLVLAALECHKPDPEPFRPTASLTEDLAQLTGRRHSRPDQAELELMFGLIRAAAVDAEFGAAVRRLVLEPALAELTGIFNRAAERGEIAADARLFRRLAESLIECFLFSALLSPAKTPPIAEHIEVLVKPALSYLTPPPP